MILLYLAMTAFSFMFIFGSIALAATPKWIKAKRKDADGNHYYDILGKIDPKDSSLYDKIRESFSHMFAMAREVNRRNGDSFSWPRWLVSYMLIALHRALVTSQMSHAEMDRLYSAHGKGGGGVEPVSKEEVVNLLSRIKFARCAYPFDENYQRLEECLGNEGYRLLRHDATTSPGKVAHYVAINPNEKILLVVPRGSCGLSDMLTDLAAIHVSHALDDGGILWSHAGFLAAAIELMDDGLIEWVERFVLREGYKLDLVGHSLGGAVAALLGAMLLDKVPALNDPSRFHIWVYAPPPCIDEETSVRIEPYISTIVWNDDLVPTLSVANYIFTCKMLAHMEEQERQYHGSYVRAVMSTVVTWFGCGFWGNFTTTRMPSLLSEDRLSSMTDRALEYAQQLHTEQRQHDCHGSRMHVHVHVPGKIICLWERRHRNQPTGEINGVTASVSTFLHLHVVIPTKDCLANHFLDSYQDGMQRLLAQLGDEREHRKSVFTQKQLEQQPTEQG